MRSTTHNLMWYFAFSKFNLWWKLWMLSYYTTRVACMLHTNTKSTANAPVGLDILTLYAIGRVKLLQWWKCDESVSSTCSHTFHTNLIKMPSKLDAHPSLSTPKQNRYEHRDIGWAADVEAAASRWGRWGASSASARIMYIEKQFLLAKITPTFA